MLRLSCVVHGLIYGRFTGCDETGLLYTYHLIHRKPYLQPSRPMNHTGRDVTHILCVVNLFMFVGYRNDMIVFSNSNLYTPNVTQYFELGLPVMRSLFNSQWGTSFVDGRGGLSSSLELGTASQPLLTFFLTLYEPGYFEDESSVSFSST